MGVVVVVVVVVLFVGDPSQAATKTASRRMDLDPRWPFHRRRRTECTDRMTASFLAHITVRAVATNAIGTSTVLLSATLPYVCPTRRPMPAPAGFASPRKYSS